MNNSRGGTLIQVPPRLILFYPTFFQNIFRFLFGGLNIICTFATTNSCNPFCCVHNKTKKGILHSIKVSLYNFGYMDWSSRNFFRVLFIIV